MAYGASAEVFVGLFLFSCQKPTFGESVVV
jgi:hypothetical protein